ncbi:unnamed protein product [Peniophora sp. CBMAI 1063]|nr:unnamed protein product [Peniophora sp. CBMAI 1063]
MNSPIPSDYPSDNDSEGWEGVRSLSPSIAAATVHDLTTFSHTRTQQTDDLGLANTSASELLRSRQPWSPFDGEMQGAFRTEHESPLGKAPSSPTSIIVSETPLSRSVLTSSIASAGHVYPRHGLVPPQERRVQMHTALATNPLLAELRQSAPFMDRDGSPVFVGSALIDGAVYPCKVTLSRSGEEGVTPVRVPLSGKEVVHHGVYEILVIDEETMEWVGARNGRLPFGRAPVEGGYDDDMKRLYYAATTIHGCRVPGKTWENEGANFPWNGQELVMRDGYDILCWRSQFYVPRRSRDPQETGLAPFSSRDGRPSYVISAPLRGTRQPAKATLHNDTARVRISYSGKEIDVDWASAEQPVEIVHVNPDTMEWVPSNHGRLPIGLQPVEGGYDKGDRRLYHATHDFDGHTVPGKTGEHLGGALFPYGGKERSITHGYKILCWTRDAGIRESTHTWLVPPPPRSISLIQGVYIGIAHCSNGSRQPGSVTRGSPGRMIFPHDGRAILDFYGPYDILEFEEDKMQWILQVKDGAIPADCRPVEAGYEADGKKLYFARHCPSDPYRYGKTGRHLKAGHFVQDGKELILRGGYDILCWKDA